MLYPDKHHDNSIACRLSLRKVVCLQQFFQNAGDKVRTCDLIITNDLLYQLSYTGKNIQLSKELAEQVLYNLTPFRCTPLGAYTGKNIQLSKELAEQVLYNLTPFRCTSLGSSIGNLVVYGFEFIKI